MKILVTGVKGQLGYDVLKELNKRGFNEVIGVDKEELDISKEDDVNSFITQQAFDIVFHCAAYTAVDAAEDNKELSYDVNVNGTKYISKACKKVDATLFYVSTDYVFDGKGDNPFSINDKPNPINYYGETKYLGEKEVLEHTKKHFIIRISWVFGINGHNFVKTMLKLGKTKDELTVVRDQIGSPTYTYDLAKLLCDMMKTDHYGIYHATNEGFCSWYDFACEIFNQANIEIIVNPLSTEHYPTKAIRPKNSRLSKESLIDKGFHLLPTWQDALNRYLKELGEVK